MVILDTIQIPKRLSGVVFGLPVIFTGSVKNKLVLRYVMGHLKLGESCLNSQRNDVTLRTGKHFAQQQTSAVSPEILRLGHHPWDSGTISCCEPQSGALWTACGREIIALTTATPHPRGAAGEPGLAKERVGA